MHLACRYGHHTLVRDLMIQYGMDPNENSNVSNFTAAIVVWLARPSHLNAWGAEGKGLSSGSNN